MQRPNLQIFSPSTISYYIISCKGIANPLLHIEMKLVSAASAYPVAVVQSSFVVEGRCSRRRPSPAHGGPSGSQCCWPVLAGTEPALSQHCQTPG